MRVSGSTYQHEIRSGALAYTTNRRGILASVRPEDYAAFRPLGAAWCSIMFFTPRAKIKPLAEFLRRLGMSLEAGIDVRKALASEVERSAPGMRAQVEAISSSVNTGHPLAEAFRATGSYFPSLVRQLVSVGEQTGHLPEVLRQLTEHYDQHIALRRVFLGAIAWPMLQLAMALGVVGLLIWVMGWIEAVNGKPVDVFGFGLVGTRGLIIYFAFLASVGAGLFALYRAIVLGKLWTAPIQRLVLRIPKIGSALRTLAVARFAWTLHLALDAAMDVKPAMALAISSARNIDLIEQRDRMLAVIERGGDIHEALTNTGRFPREFLNAVHTGEESGRLVETLAIVARQQQEEARAAMAIFTRLAGYAVWFCVAAIIITLIFRLAGFYFGVINDAARGR